MTFSSVGPSCTKIVNLQSAETKPLRQQVGALAREYGVRDRRTHPLDGTQQDEQLSFAV